MTTATDHGVVPEFDLGDRMRRALRYADVSVQAMADYLEVSRNSVGNWLNGRAVPSGAVVRLWALRTGVSHAWLKDGTGSTHEGPKGGAGLPRLDSNQQPSD